MPALYIDLKPQQQIWLHWSNTFYTGNIMSECRWVLVSFANLIGCKSITYVPLPSPLFLLRSLAVWYFLLSLLTAQRECIREKRLMNRLLSRGILFIMLHKMVLTFESMVEILKCAVPHKFQLNLLSSTVSSSYRRYIYA